MKKHLLPLLLLVSLFSCDENEGGFAEADNFDRKPMLVALADSIIVPAYEAYDSEIKKMKSTEKAFVETPTEANLIALRANWINAYKKFQHVAMFEIGKAEELFFRDFMNSYPTSVNPLSVDGAEVKGIRQNISSGSYNLTLLSNKSVQGFPAMDYLLNGLGTDDAEILTYYTTNTDASKYKNYLTDVVTRMETLSAQVLESWKTTYRNAFVNDSGSSGNSSTNKLVNSYIYHYETRIRNVKIAIPTGLRSNEISFGEKVEAFYKNDISKILLLEALNASQDFFNGKVGEREVTSIKSYLEAVQKISPGEDLIATINANFDNASTKTKLMSDSFSAQIKDDNLKMRATYDALHKNVVPLKVNMVQLFKIQISYQDADGD